MDDIVKNFRVLDQPFPGIAVVNNKNKGAKSAKNLITVKGHENRKTYLKRKCDTENPSKGTNSEPPAKTDPSPENDTASDQATRDAINNCFSSVPNLDCSNSSRFKRQYINSGKSLIYYHEDLVLSECNNGGFSLELGVSTDIDENDEYSPLKNLSGDIFPEDSFPPNEGDDDDAKTAARFAQVITASALYPQKSH